jgi:hypothetical protein
MRLDAALLSVLASIAVLPRRLSLDTPGVAATVPMLRGVWGSALLQRDGAVYETTFAGTGTRERRVPLYIMRPAAPDRHDWPAVEWIVIGDAIAGDTVLRDAWAMAAAMGLGPKRVPFAIRACLPLGPDHRPDQRLSQGWTLDRARWPLPGDPAATPCRIVFPVPLRILRRGALITDPTLRDVAAAACRRLHAFLPEAQRPALAALRSPILAAAAATPARSWRGRRLDLVRYSGRQKRPVELYGVAGSIDLPRGPGDLWPLLAAATWVHVGKGTIVGLGQVAIEPMD